MNIPENYQEALDELVNLLSKIEEIKRIIVFGDVARGEVTSKSNIEICLDTTMPGNELLADPRFNKVFYHLLAIGIEIQVDTVLYHMLDGAEKQEILGEGAVIYRR